VARPKSDDKRSALLQAAARVVDAHGLGAPTALIAREAGLANGTLFNYFATKTELFNQLYLEIKKEMAAAAQGDLAEEAEPREQIRHVWTRWMRWAVAHPEKRRTMAQLAASEEITPATRDEGARAFARVGALIERTRAQGPMRDAPMEFIAEITDAIAGATMDAMVRDSGHADERCQAGFEALWRVVHGP